MHKFSLKTKTAPSGISRGEKGSEGGSNANSDRTTDQSSAEEKAEPWASRHTPDKTCIVRLYDAKSSLHSWRVQISRNGKLFEKKFSENRHGGEQATFALAQAWRDDIILKHAPMSLAEYCSISRSHNTSGMTGVHRLEGVRLDKDDRLVHFALWQANIALDGRKSRTRSFSIKKYGEERAKQLAIDARKRALAAHEKTLFKFSTQPMPVTAASEILRVQEQLQAEQRRLEAQRQMKAAKRKAQRQQAAQRAAERLAEWEAGERKALQTTNSSGEPYIGRYSGATNGAGWKVSIIREGKRYLKHFRDSASGGTAAALEAAKVWRDEIFSMLPIISKAELLSRMKPAGKSGVSGVSRQLHKVSGIEYWVARAPEISGQPTRRKWFSIKKFGEEQAFELAVKTREAFVAELDAVPHLFRHAVKQMLSKPRNTSN